MNVTPNNITELKPNEIFVFGSNLRGLHGGGAAYIAMKKFGAIWGQGTGIQGQSYAIPTLSLPGGPAFKLDLETIGNYVDEFIKFAKNNPKFFFYVTAIGCGIAGFTSEEIAPLFKGAMNLDNVSLPQEFIDVINKPVMPLNEAKKDCDTCPYHNCSYIGESPCANCESAYSMNAVTEAKSYTISDD